MSERTIDLTDWTAPPCPRCGMDVKALRIEEHDEDFFGQQRIARARDMNLQPCNHPISGYALQNDRVEWMPYG